MNELQITEYKDIRVLTTQQIAEAYGTDNKTISYNFNRNKNRYTEGKHYICLEGNDKIEFLNRLENHEGSKNAKTIYLWTEKGAFLHAKSLGTDKAWEVYEKLVDFYFNRKKVMSLPEQIQIIAQGYNALEDKVDDINRDLQDFKQDLPLLAVECEKITRAVRTKGVNVLGGKESQAYRDNSLRNKVYSDIYKELKRQFGVSSYKELKRSQCDKAISIIAEYGAPFVIFEEIQNCNAQLSF